MHVDLHWLDVPERVKLKLLSMVHNCLHHKAPPVLDATTAFQSTSWQVDGIFVLPGVITSLCLDTVSARMDVWHLLLPAQLPGTHLAMICVIWCLALTVSDICLKLCCFQSTSIYCALEVSHFVYCINSRLTYLVVVQYQSASLSTPATYACNQLVH